MAGQPPRRREPGHRATHPSAPAAKNPPPAIDPAWAVPAARVVSAVGALALAIVAFAYHPLGDPFTESDFYEYAFGGQAIARGTVDFARYGVIGPVYELLLAIPAALGLPAFTFARLLSIASVTTLLFAWLEIVRRHISGLAALVTVLLLAANAVLFRYGYSSTTDALALGFQALSLFALLAWHGRAAPWVAGAAAALAVLTRYNSVYLLPAAIAYLLLFAEDPPAARRVSLVQWLAAFAIVVVPWTAASVAHGHWPGETLFTNATFYSSPSATERNVQDRLGGKPASGAPAAAQAPQPLLARVVANAPAHLLEDARQVLGGPTTALCVLGVLILVFERRGRGGLPFGVHGALAFLALTPVFYSDRYSLAVLPFYLSLAGIAASSRVVTLGGSARWLAPALLVAWPLAASVAANVRLQKYVHAQLPRDVLAAAPALRHERQPGDGVLSRKGAIAFYGDTRPVAFPRVSSLAELAGHATANRARFLYYSWYEGMLRPEFWYLLDTTATVPGLARIASVPDPPAVLYRIDADFGSDPWWMADPIQRFVHLTRGQVRALEDRDAWDAYAFLGRQARLAGNWNEALVQFEGMTRGRPQDTRGWVYLGDARVALGDLGGARAAYDRAFEIDRHSLGAQLGIGWIAYADHRWGEASDVWRPLVEVTTDTRTLDAMIDAFTRNGNLSDAEAARKVKAGAAGGAAP